MPFDRRHRQWGYWRKGGVAVVALMSLFIAAVIRSLALSETIAALG